MPASPGKPTNKAKQAGHHDYAVERQIGHLLRRAHQRHCGIFADAMPADLTPQQFAALAMISQLGSVSQNELGRRIAMDPATIQGVVKRLASRGLLEGAKDKHDRRRLVLSLTTAGRRLMKKLVPAAKAISTTTLSSLTATERRTLIELLTKIG